MPGSESNIKSRKRGTRPNQNVEHETTSEEEEQKLHGAPMNFHNLWSSPSPRQPLQQTGIETEEEVDLLGDPNLRCKPYEMRSNDRVITSPASASSQSHLHVFTVPSVSSGSMKNVLDVDMDTSSPHYFRYYDASLGSNQYSYDSLRRYGKLWITLFVGLVSLGSIIAVLAVHVGSKVHAPVYTTRATIESISRAVQNEINTSQGIELGYLQSDNTMTTVPLTENALEEAFNEWAIFHKREYGSHDERRKRFHIWRENHLKTVEKNMRHGPCKKMKQHIFGDNHFKDLSPLEFKQKFLTGYKGAQYSEGQELTESARLQENYLKAMHPLEVERHPSVQAAYEMNWNSKGVLNEDLYKDSRSSNFSNFECSWWNISCLVNWMASVFGLIPGSREPRYDANSYPSSVDWRSMGAVTSIHTQGDCGACWAITAVETIESAYYIKTGKLVDLAETEVIACDNSCEQCNGGWPQNAYEYVVKHNGLPAESELDFDASWLVDLTAVLAGESDVYSQNDIDAYMADTCPSDNEDNKHSEQNSDSNQQRKRYAAIKGYDYATDRCYCYNDGSGCDCNDQNENRAVRNIASYGPATVCVDASLWQDYTGGILTSASGCSQGFMDMNHCVQVVGYAYMSNSEQAEGDEHDHGKSGDEEEQRQGYWIVRNQWGTGWGMNGYAWLAMGDNTCGILNDMTQAFMD